MSEYNKLLARLAYLAAKPRYMYSEAARAMTDAAAAVRDLQAQIADKQFRIDSLMLEFCLDEMTKEQLDNWGKHQVRASPEQEAAADAAMKDAK